VNYKIRIGLKYINDSNQPCKLIIATYRTTLNFTPLLFLRADSFVLDTAASDFSSFAVKLNHRSSQKSTRANVINHQSLVIADFKYVNIVNKFYKFRVGFRPKLYSWDREIRVRVDQKNSKGSSGQEGV